MTGIYDKKLWNIKREILPESSANQILLAECLQLLTRPDP